MAADGGTGDFGPFEEFKKTGQIGAHCSMIEPANIIFVVTRNDMPQRGGRRRGRRLSGEGIRISYSRRVRSPRSFVSPAPTFTSVASSWRVEAMMSEYLISGASPSTRNRPSRSVV